MRFLLQWIGFCAVLSPLHAGEPLPASDWITTGVDCKRFAAGDVDGDGFADLLTINGNRDLCWAPSVNGWKSGGWRVLANDLSPEAVGLGMAVRDGKRRVVVVESGRVVAIALVAGATAGERIVVAALDGQVFSGLDDGGEGVVRDAAGKRWRLGDDGRQASVAEDPPERTLDVATVTGPPYDPDASIMQRFDSGFAPSGGRLAWAAFVTARPHPHVVVRNAVVESPDAGDSDFDGLSDADEEKLETNPRDRDTDGDGLLDGWEVNGMPAGRVSDRGPAVALYRADAEGDARDQQLNPRRKDVIVNVSYFEQVDRKQFGGEIPRVQAAYRALTCANPDGSQGVWVHVRELTAAVGTDDQKMPWWDVGNKYFARSERGLMHWLQVTPWGGGQSSETGDMGGAGNNWAVFAHEFGHQLSLSHTGDSAPGWCPLYTSMMNYAYSYSFDGDGAKPHFSSGEFRAAVLDERRLREKLPFPIDRLGFLAKPPFRFTLKAAEDGTTLIDWNHDGEFDEGEVIADINYGGSTQAGLRKTHMLIGSAPSLAYIGGKCFIAAATHKQTAVGVRMHKGDEQWTAESEAASSATRFDPVLIGGPDFGVLFVRRFDCWAFATVKPGEKADDPPAVSALTPLPALTATDVSAIRVGERVLVLSRHDTGETAAAWLTLGEKPALGETKKLTLTSQVPPGLAINPADGTITVVSSARHEKNGPFCMQISSLTIEGDEIGETPAEWTHGGRLCHCTSRPVPVYPDFGGRPQLTIFHTGWADGGGTWTAWRTNRVGNKSLDDGWLTSQLYDEWTRSRVALGFADGPEGAFYAFRWDPGDHHDWKINTMFVARGGYGIDDQPMRDFDDGAKIGLWGIRHSILTMPTDAELK